MNVRTLVGAIAFASTVSIAPAHAIPWVENNAGELLATAEITTGTAPLTSISGQLDFDLDTLLWDIDLYQIKIANPSTFSAQTVPGDPNVVVSDPVLFLFGFDGLGVYMNDDISLSPVPNLQSLLPAGHPSGPPSMGLYYLGIAWGFSDPLSALGSIFPVYESNLPTDGVYGPTGSGGAAPLESWIPSGPVNFDVGMSYTIQLIGAAFAVPEPNSFALLALAGCAALLRRRKSAS